MARHSHWAQIKLKKGVADVKRGKVFSRYARLIEIAARKSGCDPVTNPSLRIAIDNARSENMPKENIERAIKKGSGELKEGQEMQEVSYEGFGPGGTAFVIDVLTDNKNRTNQTVRNILHEFGGSLGSAGATSFLFESKGVISVRGKGARENDELEIIEAGAEDIEEEGEVGVEAGQDAELGEFVVYTAAAKLGEVRKKLQEKGFSVLSAELLKIPKNLVEVSDSAVSEKIFALMEALEAEEDVLNVAANFKISS